MAKKWWHRAACAVTVLVDEAVWPWRGVRWAHLVSDESIAELHNFAGLLGLRRMSFQGDHYDISAEIRGQALKLGANAVRSRDLVRSLRSSGLRLSPRDRPGSWEQIVTLDPDGEVPDLAGHVPGFLAESFGCFVEADWWTATVSVYRRLAELAVVVLDPGSPIAVVSVPENLEWRCIEHRILELIVDGSDM